MRPRKWFLRIPVVVALLCTRGFGAEASASEAPPSQAARPDDQRKSDDAREGSSQTHELESGFLDRLPLENRDAASSTLRAHFIERRGRSWDAGINGATPEQSHVFFEGFLLNGTLASARYFSIAALDRMSLASAGYGSQLAFAPGGALSLSLPDTQGRLKVRLLSFGEAPASSHALGGPDTNGSTQLRAALGVQGVLLPGRLGVATTVDVGRASQDMISDPRGLLPEVPVAHEATLRVAGRIDLRLAAAQQLSLVYAAHAGRTENTRGVLDQHAAMDRAERFSLLGLVWRYQHASGLHITARAGAQRTRERSEPSICARSSNDCRMVSSLLQLDPLLVFQNAARLAQAVETLLDTSVFAGLATDSTAWLHHDLVAGARARTSWRSFETLAPDNALFVFDGDQPFTRQEHFVASRDAQTLQPGRFRDDAQFRMLTVSLEDHMSLKRYPYLVLTPGIAHVRSTMANDNLSASVSMAAITPHVALRWDATHDGKTIVAVGYHHYVDPGSSDVAGFLGGGAPVRVCQWDPNLRSFAANCSLSGGALARTLRQPCGPDGRDANGNRCEGSLHMPRMKEWVASTSRRVGDVVTLSVRGFDRRLSGTFEDKETNANWNTTGTGLDAARPFKNGSNVFVRDVSTADDAYRNITGMTTQVQCKGDRFAADAAYTFSHSIGNVTRSFGNAWLNNSTQSRMLDGALPEDAQHVARFMGTYALVFGLSLGGTYSFTSGAPAFTTQDPRLLTITGALTDPQRDEFPARDSNGARVRLPSVQLVGVQARWSLRETFGLPIELWADLLNAFDANSSAVVEANMPLGEQRYVHQPVRRVRLGLQVWL